MNAYETLWRPVALCKALWGLVENYESLRSLMESCGPHGTLWNFMSAYGALWRTGALMDPIEIKIYGALCSLRSCMAWNSLERYWCSPRDPIEMYGALLIHAESYCPYGIVWNFMLACGALWRPVAPFETLSNPIEIYEALWSLTESYGPH